MTSKNTLRHTLRAKCRSLSSQEKQTYSQQICQQLMAMPVYRDATHIACYMATDHEVNLDLLIEHAWQQHKNIYLPVIDNSQSRKMNFHLYTKDSITTLNKYNIKEPQSDSNTIDPLDLDLIITPLVGFDSRRHRLGQGAGFYDHYFKQYPKEKSTQFVGVAFDIQKAESLPVDSWDIALDHIVTECRDDY